MCLHTVAVCLSVADELRALQPNSKTTTDPMPLLWVSAVTKAQLKSKLDAMQFSCVGGARCPQVCGGVTVLARQIWGPAVRHEGKAGLCRRGAGERGLVWWPRVARRVRVWGNVM